MLKARSDGSASLVGVEVEAEGFRVSDFGDSALSRNSLTAATVNKVKKSLSEIS